MKGFTLIEMIIVVALIAVLSVVLVSIFISQNKIYQTQTAELNVTGDARLALDDIDSYVRSAKNTAASYSTYTAGPQTLIVKIQSIDSQNSLIAGTFDYVVFYLSSSALYRQIFPHASSSRQASTKKLASNVAALTFTYNNANYDLVSEIASDLTLTQSASGQNRTIQASSKSKLRNQPLPSLPIAFQIDTGGTLPNNLAAYWKLNETSGIRVDRVADNHLTPNNAVSYNTGVKGNALQVTDINSRVAQQYLSVGDNAVINLGDFDFTFAAWVRLDSKGEYRAAIAKGNSGATREILLEYNPSFDRFRWNVDSGSGFVGVNSLSSPSANTWYFIVVWHDSATNQIGIQVNNGSVSTISHAAGVQDTSSYLTVGTFVDVPDYYWDGRVDELGFWKRILTTQEKTDLYNGGNGSTIDASPPSPPPPPPPVNLALNKPAIQSSNYDVGTANKAVDGNTSGNWYDWTVTHTFADNQAWWQVDLGSVSQLGNINVWNRTDCCGNRLSNFYVFVSDVPFTSTDLNTTLNQPGVGSFLTPGQAGTPTTISVNRTGRYVRVQLVGTNYLSLAEVEVFSP